eukprot:281681-Lingulodinium_polyedra.AAC.1
MALGDVANVNAIVTLTGPVASKRSASRRMSTTRPKRCANAKRTPWPRRAPGNRTRPLGPWG